MFLKSQKDSITIFSSLNKKSFLLKYINCSKKKISLSFIGLSHKNNIEYSSILKSINLNKMCLFSVKNEMLPYFLKNILVHSIKSFLTGKYSLNFFFDSILNLKELQKIKENNALVFFCFLIRNKIFLNDFRINKIDIYKNLLIFSFSNVYYSNFNIINYHLYFNNLLLNK